MVKLTRKSFLIIIIIIIIIIIFHDQEWMVADICRVGSERIWADVSAALRTAGG
jgi:uncharacterized protein HemY